MKVSEWFCTGHQRTQKQKQQIYIYIYIYVLEEGPPVGKHVRAFVFKPESGGGRIFLCEQALFLIFLILEILFLGGTPANFERCFLYNRPHDVCFRCRLWGCGGAVGGEVRTLPAFLRFKM